MSLSLVKSEFIGHRISFNEDGWINATEVASFYGKRPIDWLKQKEVKEYITVLCEFHKVNYDRFVKTRRGKNVGGTWFHPELVIAFARWCDIALAVWCDDQISTILAGKHPHFDWKRMRYSVSASHEVMAEALRIVREEQGRATCAHHYVNECRLINWALTGRFTALNREALPNAELDLLARLETRNSVLVGRGLDYKARKVLLREFIVDHQPSLKAINHPVAEVFPDRKEAA